MLARMTTVADLPTPALVVDRGAFDRNLDEMTAAHPGPALRPHVKAHKCTAIAAAQQVRGHDRFCAATPREIVGMARAGVGTDLLLANESVDADRLRSLADLDVGVTVAVDSAPTIDAAAAAGIAAVLIDVNVGLPRCGCAPEAAGRLADVARARGLEVRGVMGYEGHVVGLVDAQERHTKCERSMEKLLAAHALVGGDIVSAGGTGTYAINTWANEIQAGSYALMDTAYGALGLPFEAALRVVATVISVSPKFAVADCGLKTFGMDHGNPMVEGADVLFCSDEHITMQPRDGAVRVGDRILAQPAHVDPTVAYHDRLFVADGADLQATIVDEWAVDLRGW
jgi:D-serine deaminase-like pyridoxal phosphate-dependent protein